MTNGPSQFGSPTRDLDLGDPGATGVFVSDEQADIELDTLRWLTLAEKALHHEGIRGYAELSVIFVDEQAISELNERFMGEKKSTDVLAFPIDDEPIEPGRWPDGGRAGPDRTPAVDDIPLILGDVVICPKVAAANAPTHAGTFEDEIALLVVHGILHILGHDHAMAAEAEAMQAKERELLEKFHRRQET